MPKKTKRTTAEIRKEMTLNGAYFFQFSKPKLSTNNWYNEWVAMQKYGFYVCSTGCILPYKYYQKTFEASDNLKGHERAAHMFFGRECDRTAKTNQFGWPCDEQISHLCHNPDCINPMHMVIEPRWKNVKRNYCGINGTCDCGVLPACVRTYTNPKVFAETREYVTDRAKILELLASLQNTYKFSLLLPGYYRDEDRKIKNRKLRSERAELTKKQHYKKEKRKQKKEAGALHQNRAVSRVVEKQLFKEEEDNFQELESSPEEAVEQ